MTQMRLTTFSDGVIFARSGPILAVVITPHVVTPWKTLESRAFLLDDKCHILDQIKEIRTAFYNDLHSED